MSDDHSRYEIDPNTGQRSPTHEELMRWHEWLVEHEPEFETRYAGQYLAIWDKQVVTAGADEWAVIQEARRRLPDAVPLIVYIPTEKETMLLV